MVDFIYLWFINYFTWFCLIPRMFSCSGEEVRRMQFRDGGDYCGALREGSFEMYGDRVIKLGTNMWASATF